MLVRIRLRKGPTLTSKRRKNQHVALFVSSLLTPIALMACTLGLWRIAADLGWISQFAIPTGFFSHWQVWLGLAGVIECMAIVLNRYGNAESHNQSPKEERERTLLNSGF